MLDRKLVLPHRIAELAARDAGAVAMHDVGGRTATFGDVDEALRRWATGYVRAGVVAGDRVLTMVPNSFESYYAWLGAAFIRAIEVPTNTMYRGAMLAYLLNNCEAAVAVVSARFLDRLAEVADQLTFLTTVVVPDADGAALPALPFELITGADFLADATGVEIGDGPDHHDIAAMIYTSGTTGPSKGVLVPWAELYEFVRILPADTLPAGRALYTTFPAFHVSGKAMLYLTSDRAGQLVLRESFSLSEFWNDLRTFDCYSSGLLGPMAAMLMLAPPRPEDAENPLQTTFMGPIIPQIDEFRERFGVRVGTGFGMTEVGVPLSSNGFELVNGRSCGRRRAGPPGYQVRVVDAFDEEVPPNTVGELVVRADDPWVINAGYWKMPEATAAAWRNGWFHTGDGFMEDDDGNFYFVDRIKDAIRRRGENISSFEVEAGVNAHPAVQESAVIGVPSELGEDDVKAVIVLRAEVELRPEDLIEFLVGTMPRFMIPRYVEFVDALPKTDATFRIQKVKLREHALNDKTWDRDLAGVKLSAD